MKKADRCEHIPYIPQFYLTQTGYERQKAIMECFPGAFEREHLNQGQDPPIEPAFSPNSIASFIDPKRKYNLDQYIPYVFISIDPSAGSGRSLYVLVSMFFPENQNGQYCVVFLFLYTIKSKI